MTSFTLLDDSEADARHPSSRLYTDLHQELLCTGAAGFSALIDQLQDALHQGLHAVAVFSYELGAELQGMVHNNPEPCPSRILLYKACRQLNQEQVSDWLEQQIDDQLVAGLAALRPSVSEDQFTHAIDRIQEYIRAGDSYQVNFTFRFHFTTYGNLCALYRRLRQRQSVPYGALIALPDGSAVLSLSPELFVRHQQDTLYARPMKGTAAAFMTGTASENDQVNALLSRELEQDIKNRAENVMIVDLLRNDLSRVAKLGSVQVPHLFQVQRFNSVLQMTSGISATLREEVTLDALLRAIYPCGSITGAPKYRTMRIIQELESESRGVYTGAIGWFDPVSAPTIPDFCLAVPIRTLHLQAPADDGTRAGIMGVGAGIVFDSVAADEYQESLLKARFLTGLPAQFALFETMYASRAGGCRHLDLHLQRIAASAQFFGIPVHLPEVTRQLEAVCSQLNESAPQRLKLSIDGTGGIQIQTAVLNLSAATVKVFLSPHVTKSDQLWLRHKTTQRAEYDLAWQTAEQHGGFDMLFCNERGELTEGGRSNLLVKLNGHWYTPPLSAGVLPGVMRRVLMQDAAWSLTERPILRADLVHAEQIAVCNALRGVLMAEVAQLE